MKSQYDSQFFDEIDEKSTRSAQFIVPLVMQCLRPKTVLDIGGGIGSWLAVFEQNGVNDVICVDGSYVDRAALRIAPDQFFAADLATPLELGRRFDVGICLEVGEHLPPESADTLIGSIAKHTDVVLFSAAIPHQGGTNHINEQWPDFWAGKFRSFGFRCFDWVRWQIWGEPTVAWWFKQNMLVYLHERAIATYASEVNLLRTEVICPPSVVHPELYLSLANESKRLEQLETAPRLPWAVKALTRSAKASLKYHAGRVLGTSRQK